MQTNISGVQPKILVPEMTDGIDKSALVFPSLIIKSSDAEYPQLAINEYICMQLAKACGIDTPEFWLSDNRELFVMRRFDLTKDNTCRSMEDMAVLQGKSSNDKYQSSYESISKVLQFFSSEIQADNEKLFKMVVHSCMVGNGDAHLKNFAMLYDDLDNMRLSPLYDVVNTQLYNENDFLALNLGKSKDFPERKRIIDFGKNIGVKKCDDIVDAMAELIRDELEVLKDYTNDMQQDIKGLIVNNLYRSTTRAALKTHASRRHLKH